LCAVVELAAPGVDGPPHQTFLPLEDADAAAKTRLRVVIAQVAAGIALRVLAVFGTGVEYLVRLLGGEPDATVRAGDDDGVDLALGVDALPTFAGERPHADQLLHDQRAARRVDPQQPGVAAVARGADVHLAVGPDTDGGVTRAVGRRAGRGENDT